MAVYQREEPEEQRIIALAQEFPALAHPSNDSGVLDRRTRGIEFAVLPEGSSSAVLGGPPEPTDLLLSYVGQRGSSKEEQHAFFEAISHCCHDSSLHLCTADTTFTKDGRPYGVLAFGVGEGDLGPRDGVDQLASIDSYVAGRHFRLQDNPVENGFYTGCAALSDIGACGGRPTGLSVLFVNPSGCDTQHFRHGIEQAAAYSSVSNVHFSPPHNDASLGEMSVTLVAVGEVDRGGMWPQTGIQEGMVVSIVGRVGGAAASGYQKSRDDLEYNLDPVLRGRVIEQLSKHHQSVVCTDVSDGVQKGLHTFLVGQDSLDIAIDCSALQQARSKNEVTLEHILEGGDDYALLIATEQPLEIDGVTRCGSVVSGPGQVIVE